MKHIIFYVKVLVNLISAQHCETVMANTTEEEQIVVVLSQILNSIRIFLVLFMQVYESRRRRRQLLS